MRKSAITLLLCVTGAALAADKAPKDAVAVVAGKTITADALQSALGGKLERLRAEEFRIRQAALDELIADTLLEAEAKKRQLTVARLLELEVNDRTAEPAAEAVELAWSNARGPIRELPKETAKAQIASGMREIARRERYHEFIAGLRKEAGVVTRLEPPRTPVDAAAPYAMGSADAPVQVVVFTDYQCPYCARAHTLLRDAVHRYGRQHVRVAYRNLPLDRIHPHAQAAAQAAACAGEQGKFWEMSERMFASQRALDKGSLSAHASALQLDEAKYAACFDSQPVLSAIDADRKLAAKYGVQGTPAIFINGRWMVEPSFENITSVIEDELARAGVAKPQPLADFANQGGF